MEINSELPIGQRPKRVSLEATVTRADGRVEKLGVIDDSRLSFRIRRFFRKVFA